MSQVIGHNNPPHDYYGSKKDVFLAFVVHVLTHKYEKLIGHTIAYFMDEYGNCSLTIKDLMEYSGIEDMRTIHRYVRSIERKKVIDAERRRGKSNQYKMVADCVQIALQEARVDVKKTTLSTEKVPASHATTYDAEFKKVPASHATTYDAEFKKEKKEKRKEPKEKIKKIKNISYARTREEDDPWACLKTDSFTESVQFRDGQIHLLNSVRQQWLKEFGGDEKRLDLALKSIAGYIQPRSMIPLRAQVEAKLADKIADKLDRDQRYQNAVERNQTKTQRKQTSSDFSWLNSGGQR